MILTKMQVPKTKINRQQRAWSFAGIFMILLVISMPFYSAEALAAINVQITKNSGQAGIDQFIDAKGDVWTVEATISGVGSTGSGNDSGSGSATIDPKDVRMKIGNTEREFNSCSSGALGGIVCQYLSPLTDGVKEGEWAFQVVYNYLDAVLLPKSVSSSDVVKADGSGPKITELSISQDKVNEGKVNLNFKVSDVYSGKPSVGIKKIEILDADNGQVLQAITDFDANTKEYIYAQDQKYNSQLQAPLSGEGLRKIKVTAEDFLGHKSTDAAFASFQTDFIKPEFKGELNFTDLGKFIGQFLVTTDLRLDIFDTNLDSEGVTAVSDQLTFGSENLNSGTAECESDPETDGLWHCLWKKVIVNPQTAISVTVRAVDEFANTAEKTFTPAGFTEDNEAPEVAYFGTPNIFEDKSFVRSGEQMIILRVKDQGSWIDLKDIAADLSALGKSSSEKPDECIQHPEIMECHWKTTKSFSSEGTVSVGLSKLRDKVGNEANLPRIDLFVDLTGPKVGKLEAYGISDLGEKDYFQSNDKLRLKFKVDEKNGLFILLNLNDLVMDAETKYPEYGITADLGTGWAIFDGTEACQKLKDDLGKEFWECQMEIEGLKSGHDSKAELEIVVLDTAENPAKDWPASAKNLNSAGSGGDYSFDLLALSEETNPDYWEIGSVNVLGGNLDRAFVDLDAAKITYTRAALKINLRSDTPNVYLLKIEPLGDCIGAEKPTVKAVESEGRILAGSAPEISRALIYGNSYPDGQMSPAPVNYILEFSPISSPRSSLGIPSDVNFKEAIAEYACKFKVYSRVGDKALGTAEVQEARIPVGFAYSSLGAIDENLKNRIKDIRESDFMKFADALSYVDKALKWINWIANIAQIVITVIQFVDLFDENLISTAIPLEKIGVTSAWGTALRGGCLVDQNFKSTTWKWFDYIQVPVQILNCNPNTKLDLGPYSWWQRNVLEAYNLASGRGVLGVPATSLYDNMYTSLLGLCVPGIVFNIEKAREIHCRKIICYGREVPQGIATIDACNQLYDLQMCEFYYGPIFDFVGFGGLATIGNMLKSFFASPLGFIKVAEVIICGQLCLTSQAPGMLTACKWATGVNHVVSFINSIVSSIDNRPDLQGSPYCDMAEKIDLDELTGEAVAEEEESAPVEEAAVEEAGTSSQ